MSDDGFNGTQLKQLKGLFTENNGILKKEITSEVYSALADVENNIYTAIDETEKRLIEKIESEVYAVKTELKDEIKNLALTMATKYEVKQLQDKVGISS